MAEISKALFVEVIDEARLTHERDILAQLFEFTAIQFPEAKLESIALADTAREMVGAEPHGFDSNLRVAVIAHPPLVHAHVLHRDSLAVLEPRHSDFAGTDPELIPQDAGGLEGGHLALGDPVHAVLATLLEYVVAQQLPHTEVFDALLELHRRGGLTLASWRRVFSRSCGRGDSTTKGGASGAAPGRGKARERAWSARRGSKGRSTRPGFGR